MPIIPNAMGRPALMLALLLAPSTIPLEVHRQPDAPVQQSQQGEQFQPNPMLEILPVSFVGCWRGVVSRADTTQNLNGCEAGPFVPEMYTLCYRRKPGGKFELTFSGVQMDTEVAADFTVSDTRERVEVLASDGVASVKLRSFIHFDEKQTGAAAPSDAQWSMDEQTDLNCQIKGSDMLVSAAYDQTSNGAGCFKGTWHTTFRRSND